MSGVLTLPCHIVSDAHVGAAPAATADALVGFLRRLRGEPGSLLLNGDILDFWFEWRRSMPSFALPVLGAISELRASGMPITWIAGNHDCWGGDVLRDVVGVAYQTTPLRMRLGTWDLNVEHGDGLRGDADRGYLRVKPILRHPLSVWAFRLVHPDLGTRLALGTSTASRVHSAEDNGIGLRDIAIARVMAPGGPNLVVFGHSHVAGITRAPNGGVYANPGGWGDVPRYLRLTERRLELIEYDASGEDRCLDIVERGTDESLANATERVGGIGGDEAMRSTDVIR
jgi:UDP-2,3-diacylglucosamine hydrolase